MNQETSFVRRTLIVIGVIIIVFLLAMSVHFALKIFLIIFVGALLAVFYRGCSFWLGSKLNIKPQKILPFVVVFHVVISALIIYLLFPRIAEQANIMVEEIPDSIRSLKKEFYQTQVGGLISRNMPEDGPINGDSSSLMGTVLDFFAITFTVLVDILLIYIFALFLSFNPGLYRDGFIQLFPVHRRERIREVWETVNVTLFKWFIGMILDMTSIFIMTAIALWIMDIPLVLTLALIAFLFSFVPNIGPILSAIPAVLIAFTKEPVYAVYVGLAYLGIQMIESYFVTPNVQKRAIKMPPLLLLSFQLIMATFAGPVGLIVSTPLLAAIIVVVRMLYVEDVLEKKAEMDKDKVPTAS